MAEPPNKRSVVDEVFATGKYDLSVKDGCGCFTEEVAFRLHGEDQSWKHLKKVGAQNQWNGHAVDALLHEPTGYAVDIIVGSAEPGAKPGWNLDRVKETGGGPRYLNRPDLAIVPTQGCQGTSTGPPAGTTHRYDGGGNDTGTCDTCGQPRNAPIHAIPQSKAPHTYDGGEQDTGLCDICGQGRGAAIHGGVTEPEPEPGELKDLRARVNALEGTATSQSLLIREQVASLKSLRERVEAIEQQPAPTPELPDLVAVGSTGRAFGHGHPVRLQVVRGRA